MRRDFRGRTEGNEQEIVEGDLVDIGSCDAVLADFSEPDEGTAMEAWYAHGLGVPVVVYTAGRKPHPWTVYVAASVHAELDDAVRAGLRDDSIRLRERSRNDPADRDVDRAPRGA
jgi:nucleoside 2-deoxyribosyltransferase